MFGQWEHYYHVTTFIKCMQVLDWAIIPKEDLLKPQHWGCAEHAASWLSPDSIDIPHREKNTLTAFDWRWEKTAVRPWSDFGELFILPEVTQSWYNLLLQSTKFKNDMNTSYLLHNLMRHEEAVRLQLCWNCSGFRWQTFKAEPGEI